MDLLSTTVAQTLDSLRPVPQFAIAVDRDFDGVPTFQLCEGDAPLATALVAGAILSLAFFNSVTSAMEHSRERHWRNDLAVSGHQSRLWASGWPARVPSVYAAGPGQTGNPTPGHSRNRHEPTAQSTPRDAGSLGELPGTQAH